MHSSNFLKRLNQTLDTCCFPSDIVLNNYLQNVIGFLRGGDHIRLMTFHLVNIFSTH